jgi:hypothetical protein
MALEVFENINSWGAIICVITKMICVHIINSKCQFLVMCHWIQAWLWNGAHICINWFSFYSCFDCIEFKMCNLVHILLCNCI